MNFTQKWRKIKKDRTGEEEEKLDLKVRTSQLCLMNGNVKLACKSSCFCGIMGGFHIVKHAANQNEAWFKGHQRLI